MNRKPTSINPLSEAGRALAAARRVVGKGQCEECGEEMIITTAGAPDRKRKYCSNACKIRAHRRRRAEEQESGG
jgi:hypothetical protein